MKINLRRITNKILKNIPKKITRKTVYIASASLCFAVIIIAIGFVSIVWMLSGAFVSPPSRGVQDYHKYWLNNPEKEGVRIVKHSCVDNTVPCMFITLIPSDESHTNAVDNQNKRLGSRGQLLRTQLTTDFDKQLASIHDLSMHPKGIVVLLHGKNGRKEDLFAVAARYAAIGMVSVVLDMPAHGDNPIIKTQYGTEILNQQPDFINQSLMDVHQWIKKNYPDNAGVINDTVVDNVSIDERLPAYIWGLSMGGSYAIHAVANQSENWQGMIIVSSFDKMDTIIDAKEDNIVANFPSVVAPVMKKTIDVLFDKFIVYRGGTIPKEIHPVEVAKQIDLPVMVIHGQKDELISVEQAQNLYNNFGSTDKQWMLVPDAGHDNVLITRSPVYATTANWMLERLDNP